MQVPLFGFKVKKLHFQTHYARAIQMEIKYEFRDIFLVLRGEYEDYTWGYSQNPLDYPVS